jgi:outer membrane protein assembly factor BamB
MNSFSFRSVLFSSVFLLISSVALDAAQARGGLVVQLGAGDSAAAVRLARTGRFVINVLDADGAKVQTARAALVKAGVYGLVSAEKLDDAKHLPYTENLVNEVAVHALGQMPLAEVFRVLVPRGFVSASPRTGVTVAQLKAAGFEAVARAKDGSLIARKPWPKNMDSWTHSRHGASGNAVSLDTAVGPPERVRWVAAAMEEVEGLVSDEGRNFYGGVLARDSFNGLRLWHRDLMKGEVNAPKFTLPKLSYTRARPVASGKFLFAIVKGKLIALEAATGKVAREYPGMGEPNEVIHHRDIIIASDDKQVRAFSTHTAKQLWQHDAGDPRNLAAAEDTVSFIRGRLKRGEPAEAMAVDLKTGKVNWQASHFPWMKKVYRTVMHGEQVAYEVSSLSDHDAGNALHVLDTKTGRLAWEKTFPPGMNHSRQARAMFTEKDLWILHGGRENTTTKEGTTRALIEVSALDPKTGKVLRTLPAGMTHCFPPVATPRYVFAGVLDLTDMKTGDIVANRITKANCSRENGWVPANGLIYTTPKHCTCWPMLRGFVAMAPALENSPLKKPIDQVKFPLVKGPAAVDANAKNPVAADWPTYRGDRWRSGTSITAGPSKLESQWSVKLQPEPLADGPIAFDWRENPFVKGPVSAPTVANGRVFVARSDAHEVIAMNAADGKRLWSFTARGRVDLPPTIHRGLALFGCHAGFVYAVRADTGKLAWELRAAPVDERIVAYGQVESPWPVPGAVLVKNKTAYFVAGRQQLADGGVLIFAVDPLTGKRQWVHRLDSIPQKDDPTGKNPFKGFYENSGLEFDPVDILHEENGGVAMSRWIFSDAGKLRSVDKWNAFAKLDTGGGAVWVPRGSWTYGARHQDRYRGEAPRRPLVVFRDGKVYGQINGSTDIFRRDFDDVSVAKFDGKWITGWAAGSMARKGGKPFRTLRVAEGAKWVVDPFLSPAEKAKPVKPGTQLYNDIHALALAGNRLYAVHKDGRLKVFNTADGKVLASRKVPPPMWDGLAIASGRLYLTTKAGEVLCLGE